MMVAMLKTLIVLLFLIFAVMPIRAFDRGHELYEASMVTKEIAISRAGEGSVHEFTLWVRYATYVDGFIGGLQFSKMLGDDSIDVCIEEGEPLKDAREAVRTHLMLLSRAGDALNMDARMIVYLALAGKYPCN